MVHLFPMLGRSMVRDGGRKIAATSCWLAAASVLGSMVPQPASADWPQFRGPGGGSVAAEQQIPVRWDDAQAVAWIAELPGRGVSSPIIVRDRVLLTATSGFRNDRLHVLCFDAPTGKQLWQRQFWAAGYTDTHESITGAAPTAFSDGRFVYAFFSSNDLFCLDLDGNLQWYRALALDRPKAVNDVGMASSPVVVDGVVVVQAESQGDAFAAGIDGETGETLWCLDRAKLASWTSPVALPGSGQRKSAVILQSRSCLSAHDPRTGDELWRIDGSCSGIPSTAASGNRLYVPMNGLTALEFSAESAAPRIVWDSNRMSPGSSSPLAHEGRVYVLSNASIRCGDAANGELLWSVRLKGRYWATPVLAGGHLFCLSEEGNASIVQIGEQGGEVVCERSFGEAFHASPAIAGGAVYVRSDRHLWKFGR